MSSSSSLFAEVSLSVRLPMYDCQGQSMGGHCDVMLSRFNGRTRRWTASHSWGCDWGTPCTFEIDDANVSHHAVVIAFHAQQRATSSRSERIHLLVAWMMQMP
jgi:hypothetical protein